MGPVAQAINDLALFTLALLCGETLAKTQRGAGRGGVYPLTLRRHRPECLFGLAVKCKQKDLGSIPPSAVLSLQKLWYVDTVL